MGKFKFANVRKGMKLLLRDGFPFPRFETSVMSVVAVGNAVDGKFVEVQFTDPCTHKKNRFWVEMCDVQGVQISDYHGFEILENETEGGG